VVEVLTQLLSTQLGNHSKLVPVGKMGWMSGGGPPLSSINGSKWLIRVMRWGSRSAIFRALRSSRKHTKNSNMLQSVAMVSDVVQPVPSFWLLFSLLPRFQILARTMSRL